MLRIKHKNISMQFVTLVVLCMCFSLVMSILLTSTRAAQPPQQPYYVVDAYQTPGVVFRIVNREPDADDFFGRRSGNISSIALCNGQLYFCSANDRRIYQTIEERERVVFEHTSYVRDIAVDPNGNFYFSAASGAGSDGAIYELRPRANELGSTQRFSISRRRPIRVYLNTVDGFWAGDFTFDAQSNLYISSGNHIPAFIYRLPRDPNGVYGRPQRIYKDNRGAIKGIAMGPSIRPNMPQDFIYYADWRQTIYKLNIRDSRRSREFSFSEENAQSGNRHLSDIAFDIRSPRRD